MNLSPTLQTLKLDCLLEILKYVSLPVCMSLRTSCSQLKTAVDEHFRTGVKALPVMLSSHYLPEYAAQFDQYCQVYYSYLNLKTTISSGVSQREFCDRQNMFPVLKQHFPSEDYLILFDMTRFDRFIDFITKYLPAVTKLALLIDHNDHLNNISTILNIYRKQLKVLKLEKTLRSGVMFKDEHLYGVQEQKFGLPNELYDSLTSLEALEKLYFFTKSGDTFCFSEPKVENGRHVVDSVSPGHQCIDSLARRLKVLHIMCDISRSYQRFRFKPEIYESLEELACWSSNVLKQSKASFPRLERLLFSSDGNNFQVLPQIAQNLRYISALYDIHVTRAGITELNNIRNLERIRCRDVVPYPTQDHDEGVPVFNTTIQYIEVFRFYMDDQSDAAMKRFKHCMSFFRNLKKVIIREPYLELTAADLLSDY